MKTTRIEFTSDNKERFVTVQHKGEYLLAELLSPEVPNGRKHWVGADDADDIRSAAELLFCFLEGHDLPAPRSKAARQAGGTNSPACALHADRDIHDMYLRLLPLSDI